MIKILALLLLLPTLAWAGPEMLMMCTNGMGTVSGSSTISDDFTSDTSSNYTAISYGITVTGGVATGTTNYQRNAVYHKTPIGSANQTVQASVNYNGTSEGGSVLARVDATGTPTGYAAYFSTGGTISLYRFSGSTYTYISSYNGGYASGTYTLKLTANGTTFKVYLDTVEVLSTTDSTYSSGNYCGIAMKRDITGYAATVDDLSASAL